MEFRVILQSEVLMDAAIGTVRLILTLLDDQGPLTGSSVAQGTIIGGLIAAVICPAVIWLCYVPTFRRKRQVILLCPEAVIVAAGIPDEKLDEVFESLKAKRNMRGKFGLPFTVTFDAELISFWRGSGKSLEEFLSIPAQEVVNVEALEGADWTGRWSRLCAITLQRSGQQYQLRFAPYAEAWAVVRKEPRWGALGRLEGIVQSGDDEARWALLDRLGSVVAEATGVEGADISELVSYAEYGEPTQESIGYQNPYGFTGQLQDGGTGRVSFGSRDYDPATAAWFAPDEWPGLHVPPQSLNRYAYVLGNPVAYADMRGFKPYEPGHSVTKNGSGWQYQKQAPPLPAKKPAGSGLREQRYTYRCLLCSHR